jgi:DNA-binding transcriptional ArsR family regulator
MGAHPIPADDGDGTLRLSRVSRTQEEAILAALGDAQARAILLQLNNAPRSAQDLTQVCGLPQASVYRKLRELQDAGLVGIQRSVLTPDGHRTDLFRSLLVSARVLYRGDRAEVLAAFRTMSAERLGDMWDAVRSARDR